MNIANFAGTEFSNTVAAIGRDYANKYFNDGMDREEINSFEKQFVALMAKEDPKMSEETVRSYLDIVRTRITAKAKH